MLNKSLVFLAITILLLSGTVNADSKAVTESGFNELMACIKKVPLDAEQYKGVSSQQVLLLAVIKNINHDSKAIEDIGIDINFSELYQLVKISCPKELELVETLSTNKLG